MSYVLLGIFAVSMALCAEKYSGIQSVSFSIISASCILSIGAIAVAEIIGEWREKD